jgi:hypothetical protein
MIAVILHGFHLQQRAGLIISPVAFCFLAQHMNYVKQKKRVRQTQKTKVYMRYAAIIKSGIKSGA